MLTQRTEQEPDFSTIELAVFYAGHGDPETASEMVRPGWDSVAKNAPLNEGDWTAFREQLLRRGIVLVDGEDGRLYATEAACCVWCREVHGVDDPHAACSGPVPLDEVEDDTASQCASCLHAVQGPPAPYCCAARQKLIEALHGDEAMRIKQCLLCHGTGVLSHGHPCNRCSGTGVAGVRS